MHLSFRAVPGPEVRPAVRRMLELLEPAAAVLMNRLNDLLAWTTGPIRCRASAWPPTPDALGRLARPPAAVARRGVLAGQ